jgi:hypothetical protein
LTTGASLLNGADTALQYGRAARKLDYVRRAVNNPAYGIVLGQPGNSRLRHGNTLTSLQGSAYIRVGDFDQHAAVELAIPLRAAFTAGDIRENLKITKTKLKIGRSLPSQSPTVPACCTPTTTA